MIKVKFEKERPDVTFSQLYSGNTFIMKSNLYIKIRNANQLEGHVGFNAIKVADNLIEIAYIDDRETVALCDVEISVKKKEGK